MLFRVDGEGSVESVDRRELVDLGLTERYDLQEWVIDEPRILGEELLVITSEYAGFEGTLDRLDVLALDREGKLVVIELKRDEASTTIDLQAIKYASFCSTLTGQDVQELYRDFHNRREETELSPGDVADRFLNFLDIDIGGVDDSGWAEFELDNHPRILLAAGDFGIEVTAPVTWLYEEYGLDISCVRLNAYAPDGEYLVHAQRIIPIPEAEEYMTRRREKQRRQQSDRRERTLSVLLDRGVLVPGDQLLFNKAMFEEEWSPEGAEERWDPDDDLWRAEATGKEGRSNNVRWRFDGGEYSFTALSKAVLRELGEDEPYVGNGYWYWTHPEFDGRNLSTLRDDGVTAYSRKGHED